MATELFLSIVNRGVVIVQLMPEVVEFRKPVTMTLLVRAVMELSRGHSESAAKSARSTFNRERAFAHAREGRPSPRGARTGG